MQFKKVSVGGKEYLIPFSGEGPCPSINGIKAALYKYGYIIKLGRKWHKVHEHNGNPIRSAVVLELLNEKDLDGDDMVYLHDDNIVEEAKDGWKISFAYLGENGAGTTLTYIPVETAFRYWKGEISEDDVLGRKSAA